MTTNRKIFWTCVTLAVLVGYFVLFFWIKANKADAQEETASVDEQVEEQSINQPATITSAEVPESVSAGDGIQYGYFAGGCFWCIEADFEKLDGVGDVISGYTGGEVENPEYKQVTYEDTGHREAVEVPYDPTVISYAELVDYFFRHIDPLDASGQFCDKGFSYTTAIWVQNEEERTIAEAAKQNAEAELDKTVVTPILKAKKFWDAEDYHQDYYKKNPLRYKAYRTGCRRDARVRQVWEE